MAKPNHPKLHGVHILYITPLTKNYELNEEAARQEVEWCVQNGFQGIWTFGYIGEWTVLDEEFKRRLLKIVADQNKGRLYLNAGVSGVNSLQCVKLANYAEELGYNCAWLSMPTPRKMTDDEMFNHFKQIHDRTRIPLGLYNTYPKNMYVRPKVMRRIAELERVITCKEAIGDYCHMINLCNELKDVIKDGFKILSVPYNFLPILEFGGVGVTSNNWDGAICMELIAAFNKGDMNKCWQLQRSLNESWPFLLPEALAQLTYAAKVETSVIGLMKIEATLCMDIEMGPPMLPFFPASPKEVEWAKQNLAKLPYKVKPFKK